MNEIKISFVTCTHDFVGQGRLITLLPISIPVIGCARKIFLVCFWLNLFCSYRNFICTKCVKHSYSADQMTEIYLTFAVVVRFIPRVPVVARTEVRTIGVCTDSNTATARCIATFVHIDVTVRPRPSGVQTSDTTSRVRTVGRWALAQSLATVAPVARVACFRKTI